MSRGWIAIPRDLCQHWIWYNARHFQMWIMIVFLANWEDSVITIGNTNIEVKRGELVIPLQALAHKLGCTKQTAFSFITALANANMIKKEIIKNTTKITILNYDEYSPKNNQEKERNSHSKKHFRSVPLEQALEQIVDPANNIELINKNQNKKISSSLRAENQIFFDEIRKDDEFWEECVQILESPMESLKQLSEKFFREKMAKEDFNVSLKEIKSHLINWLRRSLEIQNEKQNKTKSRNGKTGIENRRGYDAPSPKGEELSKGTF